MSRQIIHPDDRILNLPVQVSIRKTFSRFGKMGGSDRMRKVIKRVICLVWMNSSLYFVCFQVLTLHASNLTNEDLTLTFLAPPSFSSPSVLSLNCSPPSPMSPFDEPVRVSSDRQSTALQRLWSASKVLDSNSGDDRDRKFGSFNEKTAVISDILHKSDMACPHMWLKSRVPLGYEF